MGEPLVRADITLNTTAPKISGFTDLIFIGSHRWFPERVRIYTSKDALAEDMPTTSNEYIAGSLAFSQKRPPDKIYIGRREADATLTPLNVAEGTVYTFTITVNDGDSALAQITATAGQTAENIATAAKAVIDGDANVAAHVTATVVGTGAAATLEIVATASGDVFSLTAIDNWGFEFSSTETAAEVKAAVAAENNNWYCVTTDDHSETFVTAMAAAVAGERKAYFVGLQEKTSISTAYSEAATDIAAKLRQLGYLNTAVYWHHEADTKFPETGYFASSGGYTPGEVTWINYPIIGIDVAKNPDTGLELSETEQLNLINRYASYSAINNLGTNTVFGGKTASGNWIDEIRFSHYWPAKIEEGVGILILNQQGTKLGGDKGIAAVKSACDTVSERLVTTSTKARGLDYFKFTFPRNKDIPPADRASRVLRGTYYGEMTGAFGTVRLEGIVTYAGLI